MCGEGLPPLRVQQLLGYRVELADGGKALTKVIADDQPVVPVPLPAYSHHYRSFMVAGKRHPDSGDVAASLADPGSAAVVVLMCTK